VGGEYALVLHSPSIACGFLPVAQLKIGMHLLQADGRYGIITNFHLVPGVAAMYNLEVAQDHTYTVGAGQWVVHNCARSNTSGNNPSAQRGNQFHYDLQKGGPAQLQATYPQTDFDFAPRFQAGPDVEVVGGVHPSDPNIYPGTTWRPGSDFGDFKPDNASGQRTFQRDIQVGKLPPDTVPIWYDPAGYIITRIGP
jgi:hypothetical protein